MMKLANIICFKLYNLLMMLKIEQMAYELKKINCLSAPLNQGAVR